MQWAAWAVLAAGVVVGMGVAPTVGMYAVTARRRFTPATVPFRPVALVLGAGAWPTGPSPLLARRLDIAAELFHTGKVGALLVSGDNRAMSNRETDVMLAYLVRSGVPASVIVADPAGFRTWDSAARARQTYGISAATVVTQAFHLPRSLVLCAAAGIDTVGVGDPAFHRRLGPTLRGYLREAGANVKAVRDVLVRPAPMRVEPLDPHARAKLTSTD
ncbi:SanA/YdcF family protein [Salinactinospora qingdaonensis]|uniref:DUF218 domain-containing protein n=1 Tax=Salinactinospora qingdaonensis TaxID=702744 RepID=A0ABP7EZT0_9ACTN